MKERPILMSGEMVRAILEGRKTMTRRVVKGIPDSMYVDWVDGHCVQCTDGGDANKRLECPYGQPGDRLWVKEAVVTHASITQVIGYVADGCAKTEHWEKLRNPRFMPRWASRILLEVVSVRVERLQDISEGDALEEGCVDWVESARDAYHELWNSLYTKEPEKQWDANPWVWVIEFKRVTQ